MERARWVRPVILVGLLAATSAVAVVAQKASSPSPSTPAWFDGGAASPVGPAFSGVVPSILGGDNIPDLVISPGTGALATRVIDGLTLGELGSGFPFGSGFCCSVLTAMGELSGDATADIAVAMGPGGGLVRLYNGATIAVIGSGYPFGAGFSGGVSLAVGDLNGDGRADIVTGQASRGGTVRVFSGTDYAMLLSQTPFGAGYTGGLNVAADDVDGDGRIEVIVAQATGGTVAVISGATHAITASGAPYGSLPGGVFVAAADVNGDGRADVITAPGSGSSPVLVYDINTLSPLASFAPYGTTAPGGVRVAATDLTGDGRADIITIPGPGRPPEFKIFSGATFALLSTQQAYPEVYGGGVFVSAGKARPGQPVNPGPPGAPIGLDFTVLGGNVALRWSPPSTGGAPTNYRIDVGSDRGLSNLLRLNVGNVTGTVATAPAGVFFVRVVATNAWGEGPPSNEVVIVPSPTLGTGAFSATLSWDTQTDIDLHAIEPSGYHIFFRVDRRRGPTSLLDADNTTGYGPENIYTDRPVANGTYEVFVVAYAERRPNQWPTTARITVRTNVGTPAEDYRVFTRTFTGPSTIVGQNVATVTFPGGIITELTGTRRVDYPPGPTMGRSSSKP
jgi:hypothetical protein